MRNSILFGLLLTATLNVSAADRYIDYSSGSDTNDGLSTSSPWKHCPGDPAATGAAASASLAAGDIVRFKGGVTYVLTGTTGIITKWNGAAGRPIVYDGNSNESWGSGRAIITDNYSANDITAFSSNSAQSYLTIKYFDIGPIGGSASLPADPGREVAPKKGHGVSYIGGITGGVVDNCLFHALGYWFNQKPMSSNSVDGSGVYVKNCNGFTVSNCDFTKVAVGCEITSDTSVANVNITNCNFHDYVRWCVDLAPTSTRATMDHVNVSGCKFYNYYQFDQDNWKGYGDWPHTDGIFHRSDYTGASWGSDINFYNNSFYAAQSAGGTASIYITEGPSANIYNNLFIYQGKGRTIYFVNSAALPSPQVVNIVNNTFVFDYVPGVSIESNFFGNSTINVKNNAFYDTHTGSGNNFCVYIYSSDPLSKVTFDYNIYKSFNTAGGEVFNWANGIGEGALSLMRTRGWEAHGLNTDPKFVALGSPTSPTSADLHLQSDSPAKQAGVNLSGLGFPGLNADRDGNPRPASGPWDIGAYNLGGSSLAAPSNAVISISVP